MSVLFAVDFIYVCYMELVLTLIVSDGYECIICSRFYVCYMTGSYLDSQ